MKRIDTDILILGSGSMAARLIEEIERDVAGYARRHELPPGLTGFAQINDVTPNTPDFYSLIINPDHKKAIQALNKAKAEEERKE